MTDTSQPLSHAVKAYRWYHTIELAPGVVTPGMFDHRPVVDRYLLPRVRSRMRCLDVGTMDGFWAFEMERRGASEVVAADLAAVDDLDWPPHWRNAGRADTRRDQAGGLRSGSRRSRVEGSAHIERSIYDWTMTLASST